MDPVTQYLTNLGIPRDAAATYVQSLMAHRRPAAGSDVEQSSAQQSEQGPLPTPKPPAPVTAAELERRRTALNTRRLGDPVVTPIYPEPSVTSFNPEEEYTRTFNSAPPSGVSQKSMMDAVDAELLRRVSRR